MSYSSLAFASVALVVADVVAPEHVQKWAIPLSIVLFIAGGWLVWLNIQFNIRESRIATMRDIASGFNPQDHPEMISSGNLFDMDVLATPHFVPWSYYRSELAKRGETWDPEKTRHWITKTAHWTR